jgi:two-component system sensor histidine kinase/response regulator
MPKNSSSIHEDAHVLLVEDNLAEALYFQDLLRKEGATWLKFTRCDSINSALDYLKTNAPDIVLLDLTLPDSVGLNGLTKLRKESISVPILVLTGVDDQELAIRALKMGAHDYLIKNRVNGQALLRIIEFAILRTQSEIYKTRLMLMEQREQFMAALTHDLKNPLLGANRILEHLTDGRLGNLNDEQFRVLKMLKNSNKSLLNMVQNLIEVYKHKKDASTLLYEKVELSELLNSCLGEFVHQAQTRNVAIKSGGAESPLIIEADSNSIRRVLQNLLDNALKFTPSGGSIEIRTKQNATHALIEIEDTGFGINADEMPTLFQPFRQGTEGRKYSPGTGLGLYLCRQIVEAHQGKIDCTSEPGRGTIFSVSLPCQREAQTAH